MPRRARTRQPGSKTLKTSKLDAKTERLSDKTARSTEVARVRTFHHKLADLWTEIDPDLMQATYGPDWQSIVQEAFRAAE